MRPYTVLPWLLSGLLVAAPAAAQEPPLEGVLELSASASTEVARDRISVTLSTRREGPDASQVQAELKQALDAALEVARGAAQAGEVDVHTGNFAIYPRRSDDGKPLGWQGQAELVVEGQDLQGIAQLTGRITTLTIGHVGYDLSRGSREKAEAGVTADAIARFRTKAATYARQFGYSGYAIRQVTVNSSEAPPGRPMPMQARAMVASATLPIEAGNATVVVNVSGSVQMK